jgi:PKD repeat protein
MRKISIIMLIGLLTFSCSKLPLAKFEVSSTDAFINEEIIFDNKTLNGTSYIWDFGDGVTNENKEVTHLYGQEGTFTVSLTAFSKNGKNSSKKMQDIIVTKSPIQIDIENSSALVLNTWALDSINLDEIDGSTHISKPVANLWGGTNEYLYILQSPNVITSLRDGNLESNGVWEFISGNSIVFDNVNIRTVNELTTTKFIFEFSSPADPAYMETWFFTIQ